MELKPWERTALGMICLAALFILVGAALFAHHWGWGWRTVVMMVSVVTMIALAVTSILAILGWIKVHANVKAWLIGTVAVQILAIALSAKNDDLPTPPCAACTDAQPAIVNSNYKLLGASNVKPTIDDVNALRENGFFLQNDKELLVHWNKKWEGKSEVEKPAAVVALAKENSLVAELRDLAWSNGVLFVKEARACATKPANSPAKNSFYSNIGSRGERYLLRTDSSCGYVVEHAGRLGDDVQSPDMHLSRETAMYLFGSTNHAYELTWQKVNDRRLGPTCELPPRRAAIQTC